MIAFCVSVTTAAAVCCLLDSSAICAAAAFSNDAMRCRIESVSCFANPKSSSTCLRSLLLTISAGPSSFNCALRSRPSASASFSFSSSRRSARSARLFSISLRACSLSAFFSSRRFCNSVVSKPSTGCPFFTSFPSGAIIDTLYSHRSLTCGGPNPPESTAASVPVMSMPVTRSPRVTRTQSP